METWSESGCVPVYSWCTEPERRAKEQILAIARLPFVRHCATMADMHEGMSMPIGGVVACEGVVCPDFVGVDIGCGMCAVKSDIMADELSDGARRAVFDELSDRLPVGFEHNDDRAVVGYKSSLAQKYEYAFAKSGIADCGGFCPVAAHDDFFSQVGTLGGGNHFLEFQHDEAGRVWIMIHSGSRNIGKKVCDYFKDVALDQAARFYSSVPADVAFLPTSTDAGRAYLAWMDFALRFAFLNRQVMMGMAMEVLRDKAPNAVFDPAVNIHHNYAVLETHMGKAWWVHRKGATLATTDTVGIIPGSMGSRSHIVRGKGNRLSLNSCSHGAGRAMGRQAFNQAFNTPDGIARIEESLRGVVRADFSKATTRKGKETGLLDVSEAPQAYKDIGRVMEAQADLVEVVHTLRPLIVIKG